MQSFIKFLASFSKETILILEESIPLESYISIDLSETNLDLKNIDITQPDDCQNYIDAVLQQSDSKVAYGGYLEKRNLYTDKSSFIKEGELPRNIHLGIDFWAAAGTKVIVPLDGKIHSFQNNTTKGDYGPTIILEHCFKNVTFYTLYGHLSVESLKGLFIGKKMKKGQTLATLGTQDVNVNYAPHLHFQIVHDMHGKIGDYPGVCSKVNLDFYSTNCPDPNLLLRL